MYYSTSRNYEAAKFCVLQGFGFHLEAMGFSLIFVIDLTLQLQDDILGRIWIRKNLVSEWKYNGTWRMTTI